MRWASVLATAALLSCGTIRAHEIGSLSFSEGSGMKAVFSSSFSELPGRGFVPIEVRLENGSRSRRDYSFQTTAMQSGQRNFSFEAKIAAPARSERSHLISVPLGADLRDGSQNANLTVRLDGPDVESGFVSQSSYLGSGGKPEQFIGMDRDLAAKYWGEIEQRFEKKSRKLPGAQIEWGKVPPDWRTLAGFDILFFSPSVWRSLDARQREMLADWVALGGQLQFCLPQGDPGDDLPVSGDSFLGVITRISEGADFPQRVEDLCSGNRVTLPGMVGSKYAENWGALNSVGRSSPPAPIVLSFVLAFALLVGPVNFFVFAKPGFRQRLFWTTPLISVAASLLIAGYILARDGVGGHGQRFTVEILDASRNRAFLAQEQISRTGVLGETSFALPDSVLPIPVSLRDVGLHSGVPGHDSNYRLEGGRWSGDWFRSGSTQAQCLVSVEASRRRLEFAPGTDGIPVVTSSMPDPILDIFYRDDRGKVWRGENLAPGGKVTLAPSADAKLRKALGASLANASPTLRERALSLSGRRGYFFAVPAQPTTIASLPSIRWTRTGGLLIGAATILP